MVGDGVRDEEDLRALGLQEPGQGVVVGPRGLHGADDLADARLGPAPFQMRPEGGEADLGVGDRQLLVQDLRVGEAHLGHVLHLGDVDADQEPVPPRAEVLLQLTKALDSDGI